MIADERGPILAIAPHPDDETLGAGGFLLRARAAGRPIHWLIATAMRPEDGWAPEKIARREREIAAVAAAFGFASTTCLRLPSARLDAVPRADLVSLVGSAVRRIAPTLLLLPHRGDAHSDHAALHDAGAACAKWFRYPSVRTILAYETLSETDAAIGSREPFLPDVFVDVTPHLEEKLRIATLFGDEIAAFPFPRSVEALRAQAACRGAACGVAAAEAFMLLRTRL